MIKVIKDVEIYTPDYIGKKDILIVADKIEGIYDKVDIKSDYLELEIIDGEGMIAIPGLIDSHVHIIGGGGEGGFKTRTPELQLSEIIKGGITTIVGCIGTDGVCRDMKGLIAKAYALTEEGVTAYCYTGSYDIPVKSITDNVKSDILLLDKVIGVGEIALSDHRSSQPTFEQFTSVIAQARVGGLLSGKAGIVNVHLGGGTSMMKYLFRIIEETELPPTQILPTHVNRNKELFDCGLEYTKKGGYIDFTTSSNPNFLEKDELTASMALKKALDKGTKIEQMTFSSDGNGSMPLFDENRHLVGLGICSVSSLLREVITSIKLGVPIEVALKVVTSNVADILKLNNKGRISKGKDADILLLNKEDLDINTVMAKGNILMKDREVLVKGTFE